MTPADSIPSHCMRCSNLYYRGGEVSVYIMSYFCEVCRTSFSTKQWELVQKFHNLLSELERNPNLWNAIFDLELSDEHFLSVRLVTVRTILEGFVNKWPREKIFYVFNMFKVSQFMSDNLLDIIELFEEYDKLLEDQNGQDRKTESN